MFRRLCLTAILSGGLFCFAACERHDWEKTKVLHESHGHGGHQEHDDGGKHEKEAPAGGEKAPPGDAHENPEEKGGDHGEAKAESGKKGERLRFVGL
jgi:hypothetical protein